MTAHIAYDKILSPHLADCSKGWIWECRWRKCNSILKQGVSETDKRLFVMGQRRGGRLKNVQKLERKFRAAVIIRLPDSLFQVGIKILILQADPNMSQQQKIETGANIKTGGQVGKRGMVGLRQRDFFAPNKCQAVGGKRIDPGGIHDHIFGIDAEMPDRHILA